MRTRRPLPKIKKRFAIVVDGQTEFWYLQMLKKNERDLEVDIRPQLPAKKTIGEQFALVEQFEDDYERVYWIVDLDTVIDEARRAKAGTQSPMQLLLELKVRIETTKPNVRLLINQPCLEYWLLLHFERGGKSYSNCNSARSDLKKHLPDYKKTEDYYVRGSQDIYGRLRGRLQDAASHARMNPSFDPSTVAKGLSQFYQLFEDLGLVAASKPGSQKTQANRR